MGSWGYRPNESDEAEDWLEEAEVEIGFIREGLSSRDENVIRAAASLLLKKKVIFAKDVGLAIKELERILQSDWCEEWQEPDLIKKSIRSQIKSLKRKLP